MFQLYWHPEVELSRQEVKLCTRNRGRRKFYVFLRKQRHEIFDAELQEQLVESYARKGGGKWPVAPAMLAMAMLLQARDDVSDEEAVERAEHDARWRMVLGVLEEDGAPFCQTTLVNARHRFIEHGLDKAILEKSVQVAERSGGFSSRSLRAVLDSSPIFGAGRVEDSYNLIAHALRVAVERTAALMQTDASELLSASGLQLLGHSSLKAALELDWGESSAKSEALKAVLDEVQRWKCWLEEQCESAVSQTQAVQEAMATVEEFVEQDTIVDEQGQRQLRRGVAKGRRISVNDPSMGHGRKSSSKTFNGLMHHQLNDLDSRVTHEVVVCRGSDPDVAGLQAMLPELESHNLAEIKLDLGYMGHEQLGHWRQAGVRIVARPWPQPRRNGLFSKLDFNVDLQAGVVTCPAGQRKAIPEGGGQVRFLASVCRACELRQRCTSGQGGRHVNVPEGEDFQQELRQRMKTPEGRAELRERVKVEHRLAHHFRRRSRRARYIGLRKNQFDGRRHAAVDNLMLAMNYASQPQEGRN